MSQNLVKVNVTDLDTVTTITPKKFTNEIEGLRDDIERLNKENVYLQNRYNKTLEDNHLLKEEINRLATELKQAKAQKEASLRLVYYFAKQELGL